MLSSDYVDTPLIKKSKLDEDLQEKQVDATLYHGMIRSLMYMTSSRLDLTYAVCLCARYQAKPTKKHLNTIKRFFRYLKGTINLGLWYSKDIGDKLVSWSSKKQKCTAISSTEAEYIALSGCCAQILWMCSQLTNYGFQFNKIPLYCDNKSAIALCCNNVQHSRAKYIDKFVDPSFEEEILAFIRKIGYSGNMKSLSDAKKNVDYVYLLWEDSLSNRIQGVEEEQRHVLSKIYQSHYQPLYVKRLINSKKKQVMKESDTYKTYYVLATGKVIPKPKYVWHSTRENTDQAPKASLVKRLKATSKVAKSGKKKLHAQGLETLSEIALSEAKQMKVVTKMSKTDYHVSYISWKSSDDENDDEVSKNADNEDDDDHDDDNANTEDDDEEIYEEKLDEEEEGSDQGFHTPSHFESTDDEAYDEVTQGDNVEEKKLDKEKTRGRTNVQATQVIEDNHVIMTIVTLKVQQQSSSVSSGFISKMLNPNPDTGVDSILNLNTELTSLVDVPVNTNDEIAPSSMNKAVKAVVQLQLDRLREEAHEDFINKINENINKIIKDQVKVQVKEQVSKILARIEKSISKQLEAKVLIRLSNEAKTSYAVAANLSKLKLKKILIDKMENNKSIHRSVQQKSLYKALVDAYESDKEIRATYGDTITIKRFRDDEDDDEELSAEEPIHTIEDLEEPAHQEFKTRFTEDHHVEETTLLPGTSLDFSAFVLNQLNVDTLTLELLAGPTFKLMKGSCKSLVELEYFLKEVCKETTDQLDWNNPEGQQYSHDIRKPLPLIPNSRGRRVIPFDHFINNDLIYLSSGVSSRTYTISVTKTKAVDYGHNKWIKDLVPNTIMIAIKKLTIIKWHNYKHLEWITVRRDDGKMYTFKEGDYNRLRLQDIKDMLLLLFQGKLTNLNIEEHLSLGVSLRMFARSIVIQRRVEDLQLGIESYQKNLNLTKPDTYRSDLKCKTPYTTYFNPRGSIYHNQDKKSRLMHIDELYKFSDGTLNDVWSTLDDTLKNILMKYLPQTIWREVDKERAGAMIQAIDRHLRNRRIMRSLEKFVGGKLY
nr:hypothetical protein [Tanacetum cinerariifolium]